MLFTDAITYNGKHSYYDLGIAISKPKGDVPKIKEVTETVPYMTGEYNFTFITGKPAYNAKKITIEFIYEGEDPEELYRKRIEISRWIMSAQGGTLEFDSNPDWYYKDVYAYISDYNNTLGRHKASITAVFSCYPLMQSKYSRPMWCTATSTMTGNMYVLTLDECIPSFTTENQCLIMFNNVQYTIPANSKRYQITDLKFTRGNNLLVIKGNGELLVECIEEVL